MVWLTEREQVALAIAGALARGGIGTKLWLQRRPPITIESDATAPVAEWEAALSQARQIDLNHATPDELARLPGIGPTLAQRIVENRQAHGPFRQTHELQRVPGIGSQTYDAVDEYVTVR